jgi:predicted DNA-binding transcriptional regulator AlpA
MHQITTASVPSVTVPKLWLDARGVARLLSIGVRTLWRMVAQGKLPQPIRLNRKMVRWNYAELAQFIHDLRAARQAKEGAA